MNANEATTMNGGGGGDTSSRSAAAAAAAADIQGKKEEADGSIAATRATSATAAAADEEESSSTTKHQLLSIAATNNGSDGTTTTEEGENGDSATLTPSTPTVEIIEETGTPHPDVVNDIRSHLSGSFGSDAAVAASNNTTATAAAPAGSAPQFFNKLSAPWRRGSSQQQQQQNQQAQTTTASTNSSTASATATVSSFWNKHGKMAHRSTSTSFENGLKRMGMVASGLSSSSSTTTAATTPLDKAKLESPLAMTGGTTTDTTATTTENNTTAAASAEDANNSSNDPNHLLAASSSSSNNESPRGSNSSEDTDGKSNEDTTRSKDSAASYDDDDSRSSYSSSGGLSSSSSDQEESPDKDTASGKNTSSMRNRLSFAAARSAVDSMHSTYRGRYSSSNAAQSAAAAAAALVGGRGNINNNKRSFFSSASSTVSSSAADVGPATEDEAATVTEISSASDTTAANNNASLSSSTHTHRLLQSRAHDHVQHLMEHELRSSKHYYLMLLGHGMLGVNLKPTWLRNRGVYVDFLVAGGAAAQSQVVYPGDLLCQIGFDNNVRRGGILNIPAQIASTKRPVHLVLSTGTDYYSSTSSSSSSAVAAASSSFSESNDTDKTVYITYIDICAALLHTMLNPIEKEVVESPTQQELKGDEKDEQHQQEQHDHPQEPSSLEPSIVSKNEVSGSSSSSSSSTSTDDKDVNVESSSQVESGGKDSTIDTAAESTNSSISTGPQDAIEEVSQPSVLKEEEKSDDSVVITTAIPNTIQKVEDLLYASIPTKAVRNAWGREAARRANHLTPQQVEDIWTSTRDEKDWNNLQAALKHAFLLTILDGRRFPFLTRFWTQQQHDAPSPSPQSQPAGGGGGGANPSAAATTSTATPMNAMLTLFLEMHVYSDYYGVMPVEKRRQLVHDIAYKFFLPTSLGGTSNELVPPMFDFHHLVPDSSLRQLEQVLDQCKQNGDAESSSCPPRNVFYDFQQAVLEILSGKAFLSFMITDECARMRAYLRETAPFLNVPLDQVWQQLVKQNADSEHKLLDGDKSANAKNYFLYMLVYLLCQTDHEPFGEHDELPVAGEENTNSTSKKCKRMEHAPSAICAALFIQSRLLPAIQALRHCRDDNNSGSSGDSEGAVTTLVSVYEQLWEIFLSPVMGVLHGALQAEETKACLQVVINRLAEIQTLTQQEQPSEIDQSVDDGVTISSALVNKLVDIKLEHELNALAQALVYYEYAMKNHSRFCAHKFHEWMCAEAAQVFATQDEPDTSGIPDLSVHCIKRLLRKAEFPQGVSSHKPAHTPSVAAPPTAEAEKTVAAATLNRQQEYEEPDPALFGAECAVVFGTNIGLDLADPGNDEEEEQASPALKQTDIRRYTCQSLQTRSEGDENVYEAGSGASLSPEEVPQMLESYAVVPPSRTLAFANYAKDSWKSRDGWEVSVVNFMLPRAGAAQDGSDAPLYGVSLVLSRLPADEDASLDENAYIPTEFVEGTDEAASESFASPISFTASSATSLITKPMRRVRVSKQCPNFSARFSEQSWREKVSFEQETANITVTVGVALVSQRNVLFSMRDTLVRLLADYSRGPADDAASRRHGTHGNTLYSCSALADVLGNCANTDIEPESLLCILEPYIRQASKPWIERPVDAQDVAFKRMAGEQLVQSLPPIPLALMFVTVLLEQKVVFSSSRRSLLLSATTALTELLKPLKWCHLMVPRVPCDLAGDLLQYPAPFILGLPSEDPGIMNLIQDLPEDVTLVDLDVGRVILSPSFAHNTESSSGANFNTSTRVIRSQILYLAQSLGTAFGACMDPVTWSCDRLSAPMAAAVNICSSLPTASSFDRLKTVCHDFLRELLAGTTSCCYWVEEAVSPSSSPPSTATIEPTILFDEDRFFRIKRQRFQQQQHQSNQMSSCFQPLLRSTQDSIHLALDLEDFDVVVEILLRCQNMNDYIGTRNAKEMMFSL